MFDKKNWLWAIPNIGKPLLLTDSSTTFKVKGGKDRKDTVEMFHVAWSDKAKDPKTDKIINELKTPKQVPNNAIMAGYANIGHILFVGSGYLCVD